MKDDRQTAAEVLEWVRWFHLELRPSNDTPSPHVRCLPRSPPSSNASRIWRQNGIRNGRYDRDPRPAVGRRGSA